MGIDLKTTTRYKVQTHLPTAQNRNVKLSSTTVLTLGMMVAWPVTLTLESQVD